MAALIPGTVVVIGGERMVCPALSLGALEELQADLADFKGGIDAKSISTVIRATYLALKRNYPDITEQQIKDGLDVRSMGTVMQAVMGISGLTSLEGESAGEAPAGLQ